MGDHIDDLMTKRWADLEKKFSGKVVGVGAIDKLVSVETVGDPSPYRVKTMGWDLDDVLPKLRRCVPVPVGAYELSFELDLAVELLEDNFPRVLDRMGAFVRDARILEQRALLHLLAEALDESFPFTWEGLLEGADQLTRPCRLLVRLEDALVKRAVRHGLVEETVVPQSQFPIGVCAVMVELGGGPVWRRLVQDLAATWQRQSNSQITVRLTERFFLDNTERAVKFVGDPA